MSNENLRQPIVNELLPKPSNVAPTLFVGLGGAGCKVVARVARHVRDRKTPDYERMKNLVLFSFIDTNIHDLEKHREYADESFLISNFEKREYSDLASGKGYLEPDDYFTQWVPQDYRFRAGDTAGAGQIRIESRLGSYYQMKHGDFVAKFRALVERLKSHNTGYRKLDVADIRVVLCYSVAGGTGSGSHLPVSYMLRDLVKQAGKPLMLGVALMPSCYENKVGDNKDGTFANGYAALKETEHLMRLGAPDTRFFPNGGLTFHYDPSDSTKRKVFEKPFEFLYVIDRPETFSVDNIEDAAGDGLYLQLFTPLFGEQAGDYDNYTQHQRFLVPHDFEFKSIPGFTSFYASYGTSVLHTPNHAILKYSSKVATLDVIRASFLGTIPPFKEYNSLRARGDEYYKVSLNDAPDAPEVHETDFHELPDAEQRNVRNRLFEKRIRLLTECEVSEEGGLPRNHHVRACFFHGHHMKDGETREMLWPGKRPAWKNISAFPAADVANYVGSGTSGNDWNRSIFQVAFRSILSQDILDGDASKLDDIPLLQFALSPSKYDERINNKVKDIAEGETFSAKKGALEQAKLNAIDDAKKALVTGDETKGCIGFEWWGELKFLTSNEAAGTTSLVAKRYAVLQLIKALQPLVELAKNNNEAGGKAAAAPQTFKKGLFTTKKEELEHEQGQLSAAKAQAQSEFSSEIRNDFLSRILKLEEELKTYAGSLQTMEEGYAAKAADWEKEISTLLRQGDPSSTGSYVLVSEALQIETQRRMWDFYHEDVIKKIPEVSFYGNDDLKSIVNLAAGRKHASPTQSILEMHAQIYKTIEDILKPKIVGDWTSKDDRERHGLTLGDSLDKEIFYRALYLSNRDEVERGRPGVVAEVLARYEKTKDEKPFNKNEALHQDYLRDKVKRAWTEKSDLLTYIDDKHLNQGGVRPDRVAYMLVNSRYKDFVSKALEGVGQQPPRPITAWEDHTRVVFYRAMLNIPLFVFGRMNDMASFYHRFQTQRRQSKVLHIDQHWERTLQNLDPEALEREYRQKFVRSRIVDFATLYVLDLGQKAGSKAWHPSISRQEGKYVLLPPYQSPGEDDEEAGGLVVLDPVELGASIDDAVEVLEAKMQAESIRFGMYMQVLAQMRKGLMPTVLEKVLKLPFKWKKNAQTLRTRFGAAPSLEQQMKISDYAEGAERLYEALCGLLEQLEAIETERMAAESHSDDPGGVQNADQNRRDCIDLVKEFRREWERPDAMKGVPTVLTDLFKPLDRKKKSLPATSSTVTPEDIDPSSDRPLAYPSPTLVVGVGRFGLAVLERLGASWSWLRGSPEEAPSLENLRLLHVTPEGDDEDPRWTSVDKQADFLSRHIGDGDEGSKALQFALLRTLGLIRFHDGQYQVAVPRDAGVSRWAAPDEGEASALEPTGDAPDEAGGEAGGTSVRKRFFEWRDLDEDPLIATDLLSRRIERERDLDLFVTPLLQRIYHGDSPRAIEACLRRCVAYGDGRDPSPWPWGPAQPPPSPAAEAAPEASPEAAPGEQSKGATGAATASGGEGPSSPAWVSTPVSAEPSTTTNPPAGEAGIAPEVAGVEPATSSAPAGASSTAIAPTSSKPASPPPAPSGRPAPPLPPQAPASTAVKPMERAPAPAARASATATADEKAKAAGTAKGPPPRPATTGISALTERASSPVLGSALVEGLPQDLWTDDLDMKKADGRRRSPLGEVASSQLHVVPLDATTRKAFLRAEGDFDTPLPAEAILSTRWETTGWTGHDPAESETFQVAPASARHLGLLDSDSTLSLPLDHAAVDEKLSLRLQALGATLFRGLLALFVDLRLKRTQQYDVAVYEAPELVELETSIDQTLELLGEMLLRPLGSLYDKEKPQPDHERSGQPKPSASEGLRSLELPVRTGDDSPLRLVEGRLRALGFLANDAVTEPRRLFNTASLTFNDKGGVELLPFRKQLTELACEVLEQRHLARSRRGLTRTPPRLTVWVVASLDEGCSRTMLRDVVGATHAELLRTLGPLFKMFEEGFDRTLSIVPVLWAGAASVDEAKATDTVKRRDATRRREFAAVDALFQLRRRIEEMPRGTRFVPQIFVCGRVNGHAVVSEVEAQRQTHDFITLMTRSRTADETWLRHALIGPSGRDFLSSFGCIEGVFPAERVVEYLANRMSRSCLLRLDDATDTAAEPLEQRPSVRRGRTPNTRRDAIDEASERASGSLEEDLARRGDALADTVRGLVAVEAGTTEGAVKAAFGTSLVERLKGDIKATWRDHTRVGGAMDREIEELRAVASSERARAWRDTRELHDAIVQCLANEGRETVVTRQVRAAFGRIADEQRRQLEEAERARREAEAGASAPIPDPSRLGGEIASVAAAAEQKPDLGPLQLGAVVVGLLAFATAPPLLWSAAMALELPMKRGPFEVVLGPWAPVTAVALCVGLFVWLARRWMNRAVAALQEAIGSCAAAARGLLVGDGSMHAFLDARVDLASSTVVRGMMARLYANTLLDGALVKRIDRSVMAQLRLLRRTAEDLGVEPEVEPTLRDPVGDRVEQLFGVFDDRHVLLAPRDVVDFYRQRKIINDDVRPFLRDFIATTGGFDGWRTRAPLADRDRTLAHGRAHFGEIMQRPAFAIPFFADRLRVHLDEFLLSHFATIDVGASFSGFAGVDEDGIAVSADATLLLHPEAGRFLEGEGSLVANPQVKTRHLPVPPNSVFLVSLAQGITADVARNFRRYESYHDRGTFPGRTDFNNAKLTLTTPHTEELKPMRESLTKLAQVSDPKKTSEQDKPATTGPNDAASKESIAGIEREKERAAQAAERAKS